jgi:hypothetical protein
MKVMTLPADSNGHIGAANLYSHFNLLAWAGALGQTGILQILFTDINDKLVAGYGITKSDMSGNNANCTFWIGGNTPKDYTSFGFEANNGERNQKKPNNMFNSSTGDADFLKEGASLGFYWYGSRKTIYVPELENVEIAKIYLYIGQFKNSKKFINNLSIRGLNLTKNNVAVWLDVPNRYALGSKISIDSYYGTININGVASATEKVNGAKFLVIPPGESEIILTPSSWVTTAPDVELSWEENIL